MFRRRVEGRSSGESGPSSARRTRRGLVSLTAVLVFTAALFVSVFSAPVRAHLTGVFLFFIKDFDSPSYSTRLLQQQMDDIDARIEQLQPELESAREAYEEAAAPVARRLLFYDAYAASALGGLWAGSEDLIDALADARMMERVLRDDLASVKDVARHYARLSLAEASLVRYRDMLTAIEETARARDARVARAPEDMEGDYGVQYVLYLMAEDWEEIRPGAFLDYFSWTNRQLRNMDSLLVPLPGEKGWRLPEEALNELLGGDHGKVRKARFFLRADHVYFVGEIDGPRDSYKLLTVGQMERAGPTSVQYRIEGIYLDGFPVDPADPEVAEEVYANKLLHMDLKRNLPPDSQLRYEQESGGLRFSYR